MIFKNPSKKIVVDPTRFLYKWHRTYGSYQKKYFDQPVVYRREKQIQDFINLNQFKKVKFCVETDILKNEIKNFAVEQDQDLTVIACQKFSRYPCHAIIEKINQLLDECPKLYLCLVRWYINIDNSYFDTSLDSDLQYAITQWLNQSLPDAEVLDLSIDRWEDGSYFTWVIPDRHYYITRK